MNRDSIYLPRDVIGLLQTLQSGTQRRATDTKLRGEVFLGQNGARR